MGLIEKTIQFDKALFSFLNGMHTPLMDIVMSIISNKYTLIPVYLFFIFSILKYSSKKWIVLTAVVAMIGLADICASQIAKPTFKRLRPCHDTTLTTVHTVNNHCGKQYGYFSSHASTMFALAGFMSLYFRDKKFKNKSIHTALFSAAAIIAYSRVYLGVHFPLDVLTGALCGLLIAYFSFYSLLKIKAI